MMDDPDSTDPKDMVPEENQFMPVAGTMESLDKKFQSEVHMRSMMNASRGETTTDEINVFTNMEAPGSLSWAKYYETAEPVAVSPGWPMSLYRTTNTDSARLGQVTIGTAVAIPTKRTLTGSCC